MKLLWKRKQIFGDFGAWPSGQPCHRKKESLGEERVEEGVRMNFKGRVSKPDVRRVSIAVGQ